MEFKILGELFISDFGLKGGKTLHDDNVVDAS